MARVVVARWSPLRWLVCWLRARVHRQFECVCVFPIGTATTTCTSVARLLGLPLDVIGAEPCSDPFTPASFTATIHCCSTATVYCLIHCCLVHCCLFHCCLVCCLVRCSLVAMTSTCHALLVLFAGPAPIVERDFKLLFILPPDFRPQGRRASAPHVCICTYRINTCKCMYRA